MEKSNVVAAVLAALLAISESLGLNDKVKSNSIVQLVGNFILGILGKK